MCTYGLNKIDILNYSICLKMNPIVQLSKKNVSKIPDIMFFLRHSQFKVIMITIIPVRCLYIHCLLIYGILYNQNYYIQGTYVWYFQHLFVVPSVRNSIKFKITSQTNL